MIIYHEDGAIHHVVTFADPSYDPKSNGETFVQTDEAIDVSRLYLAKNVDGSFSAAAKKDMPIALLASPIKLGSDAMFLNVPEGAMISINGASLGIMDSSGSLDFTPTTTGFYAVVFTLTGYMDWSETLEVVSSS